MLFDAILLFINLNNFYNFNIENFEGGYVIFL